MRVKCVICDSIQQLPDDLPLAKNCAIVQFIRICVIHVTNVLLKTPQSDSLQGNLNFIALLQKLMKNFNE